LVDAFTLHDLRRTFASGLRQLGAPLEIIDAMLNHRSGAANEGTRSVYIHADDWPERRAWAEKWERHVLEISRVDDTN
jgi:integrase